MAVKQSLLSRGSNMQTARKLTIVLCLVLLVFFLFCLVCLAFNNYDNIYLLRNIVAAQLLVSSLAACTAIIYSFVLLFRKAHGPKQSVSKIVMLSETNAHMDKFSLGSRASALIVKGEFVYVTIESDASVVEYAVINRVENYWYIERVSEARSVGLKRAGEQYIYKLKVGMCYRLHVNDVIYVENDRLLVI
jgi:hypothetical protein